ncbi:MAG: FliM/FliN family flagellar motor switch protein [Rhodobacter sp.]|nr:FliM/FliN family flagellar motor switch protein [Rhodobacter sp.]
MLDKLVLPRPTFRSLISGSLPSIGQDDVATFKTLAKRRPSGTVSLAGKTLRYAWRSRAPLPAERAAEVWVQLDAMTLGARFERGLLEALFLEEVDFAQVDQRLYALLVEHMLTDWIESLEKTHSQKAQVSLEFSPPCQRLSPYSFDLFVDDEEDSFAVTVFGNTELLKPHLTAAGDDVALAIPQTLPLRAAIESTPLVLAQSDLSAIAVGDLLVLNDRSAWDGLFRLRVAGTDHGAAKIDGDRFRLTDCAPGPGPTQRRSNAGMARDTPSPKTGSLNVEISVEVGQGNMTVAEVAGLVPGTVIDFGEISPDDVRLRTNGEVFAHAKMIEVGDGLGLWITKVI